MSDIKEDYASVLYALNQIRKHLDEIEKVVDGFYFLFNEHSIDFKKDLQDTNKVGHTPIK